MTYIILPLLFAHEAVVCFGANEAIFPQLRIPFMEMFLIVLKEEEEIIVTLVSVKLHILNWKRKRYIHVTFIKEELRADM